MFCILVWVHTISSLFLESYLPECKITFDDWGMYHEVIVSQLSFIRQKENFICFNINYFIKTLNLTIQNLFTHHILVFLILLDQFCAAFIQ